MTRVIRRKSGDPLSQASLDQLKQLEQLPDEHIDVSDIPPWTEEQWQRGLERRAARWAAEAAALPKAS